MYVVKIVVILTKMMKFHFHILLNLQTIPCSSRISLTTPPTWVASQVHVWEWSMSFTVWSFPPTANRTHTKSCEPVTFCPAHISHVLTHTTLTASDIYCSFTNLSEQRVELGEPSSSSTNQSVTNQS